MTSDEDTISRLFQVAIADTIQIAKRNLGTDRLQEMLRNVAADTLRRFDPAILRISGLRTYSRC